jgi:hypothetical protein
VDPNTDVWHLLLYVATGFTVAALAGVTGALYLWQAWIT